MSSTVVCTATHPVDLDDGRSLPPGETADNVDLTKGSNQALVDAGALVVTGETKPGHGPKKVEEQQPAPVTPVPGPPKPNNESRED